jgi:MGT family glycosyltransferase
METHGDFLFVTWAGGGNVPPLIALGQRLRERGHRVRVLGPAALAERIANAGLAFRAYRAEGAWREGLGDDVIAEARRQPTDIAVIDYMQPFALCGAEAAGIPWVAFVHTLYAHVALGQLSPMRMAASDDLIHTFRARLGLTKIAAMTDLLARATRTLVLATQTFDDPEHEPPSNLRYVGPIAEDAGADSAWVPPASALPLVHVSLGTTPMDEAPVLRNVLNALEALPVQVVATVGDHLDPAAFIGPANAVVSRYIRHAAVLPHTALFVTHAGLSGIGTALQFGVPMLCLPLGREQPANAARVVAIGAGRVLSPKASAEELRANVTELLNDDAYRRAAARAATEISEHNARAVEGLEQLLKVD